ncbi:MAG: hypothetical protein AAGC53_17225 [Actinomycetota bacterium]
MLDRFSPRMLLIAVLVLIGVAVGWFVGAGRDDREPQSVAIVDAQFGVGGRVEVVIDRCESEPVATVALKRGRLAVGVVAGPGSDAQCRDVVDVGFVTDDIVAVEDATTGQIFALRPLPDTSDPQQGTRQ